MEPTIIITDDATDLRVNEIAEALRAIGLQDITNCNINKALGAVSDNGRTTLICGASEISSQDIASLTKDIANDASGLILISSSSNPALIDPGDLTLENLISSITQDLFNSSQMISAPSSLINTLPKDGSISARTIGIYLMIGALASGEEISVISSSERIGAAGIELSNDEISDLLRFAISECNIEDLYPNHAWREHEEESLSSCYHSLAALFIRLGDLSAAAECLNISERFEDSPRLLALRGIIAATQGRALEAVANMVSSLQQYEARKRNDGEHYLTFTPVDLEKINTDLKDGLDALNRRDNETAFEYFSKAIFNFDSFYRETGIAGFINPAMI